MSKKTEPLKPRHTCPKCGSEELDTTTAYRSDYGLTEKVFCTDCGHLWREVYTLVLEEIVEEDDAEEAGN